MAKKAVVEKSFTRPKFDIGTRVQFKSSHPLYAGQNAVVAQPTGSGNVIVELESGDRELVSDFHLSIDPDRFLKHEYLSLEEIAIDGGTQSRACLNDATVDDYAEAMDGGAEFPPVLVFYDGEKYWLADGFHRVAAAKKLEWGGISAEIRQGTRREAVLHSVGANDTHGLRRTNADKRRSVMTLLSDGEWSSWSDREIARCCKVSNNFVSSLRRSLSSDDSEKDRTYVTKHGTEATMNIAQIGKSDHTIEETSGADCPKLDNGQKLLDVQEPTQLPLVQPQDLVPEPKSKHKQLLPDVERNPDVPPGEMPLLPAAVVNLSAVRSGKPGAIVTEISIGIGHLSPLELAQVLENASNTLTIDHWEAVDEVVQRHKARYFKGESA